jgi:hypothetical protein
MQKQTPIKKSAFAPLKPSPAVIQAARETAEAKAKQKEKEALAGLFPAISESNGAPIDPVQKKEAPPMPSKVEIWCEPISRTDRTVSGWAYCAVRTSTVRAIVVTINLEYPLVARALSASDERLIAWMLGLSLSERLMYRRPGDMWLEKTLAQLRLSLFPDQPELRDVVGLQFFGDALAASAPFKRIAAELAAGQLEAGKKHWIAGVSLESVS